MFSFLSHILHKPMKLQTSHTVETFMEHQVDTIKGVADLVTRLQQYVQDNDYPLGEYLLDRELDE